MVMWRRSSSHRRRHSIAIMRDGSVRRPNNAVMRRCQRKEKVSLQIHKSSSSIFANPKHVGIICRSRSGSDRS
jgi:hypothetical protein